MQPKTAQNQEAKKLKTSFPIMADHYLQSLKQTFSLEDIDQNIDFMSHFSGIINPNHQETCGFMGFPLENNNIFPQFPDCPGLFIHEDNTVLPTFLNEPVIENHINDHEDRKRKSKEIIVTPESSSGYSSSQCSDNGIAKTNRGGRVKKVKGSEKGDEKPKEVIHVRARRGQATDSHSLAERVRRGKINERLRCLQDIVPGCYKSMGMAVMLDETINYVQSLQSQVEFLSMKLTAASTFYDFNSDSDAMDTTQRAKAFEALKAQNVASRGVTSTQFAPIGLNFGNYPELPHTK